MLTHTIHPKLHPKEETYPVSKKGINLRFRFLSGLSFEKKYYDQNKYLHKLHAQVILKILLA